MISCASFFTQSDTLYESKKKEALRLADQYNAEYWQTSSRTGWPHHNLASLVPGGRRGLGTRLQLDHLYPPDNMTREISYGLEGGEVGLRPLSIHVHVCQQCIVRGWGKG